MALEDNLGVSVRSSAWLNDGQNTSKAQPLVASTHFGQAFSQAWPIEPRSPRLDAPALSSFAESNRLRRCPAS